MPTLQADDVPGGKPAEEAGGGTPKGAGLEAETAEPTVLESWVMDTSLVERVAEAKSWKLRQVQDEWYMMWYEAGAAKPHVQALGIRVAEADALTLGTKIRIEVEEERALLEALGRKPGAVPSPATGTPGAVVGVPSPLAGTPAREKTVLSEDCKRDREDRTPDSGVAGKAKVVLGVETPRTDPVVAEKVGLTRPINFEEVRQILTAQGKTSTREECVAYLHNQLGAEVVAEGSEPAEDGYSVVGTGFLIADDELVGLRVVGIGAVDSSGSRGRYAKVTRVTNARVEVEFEDGKEGQYFTKNKAEPVDVNGLSLVTGEQVFLQAELDKAVRHRQASRVRNKLDKGRRVDRKKAAGSQATSPATEKGKPGEAVYNIFAKVAGAEAGSEPPPKKRKTGDEEEGLGLNLLPTEESRAHALEAGMRSLASGLVHLTRAGVIPKEALEFFRDELNSE